MTERKKEGQVINWGGGVFKCLKARKGETEDPQLKMGAGGGGVKLWGD